MPQKIENFGSNVSFQPQHVFYPENIDELLQIMADHPGSNLRAIGSLHSWSNVIQTTGVVLNLAKLNSITLTNRRTVVVEGGCQIKRLLAALSSEKMTLPSVGLIAEQTIAGATATGTHGSGRNSLSHYIQSVTVAHFDANGKPVVTTIESGPELFAARCSLGLLGVIVNVEIEIRPEYTIEEHARKHDSLNSVLEQESAYPLQQFYLMPWSWSYFAHHRREVEITASRFAWLYGFYRLVAVDVLLHIVVTFLARFFRFNWAIRLFYKAILPFTIIRKWKVADRSTNQLVMNHHWFRHIEIELFVTREKLPAAMEFLIVTLQVFANASDAKFEKVSEQIENPQLVDALKTGRGSYCHHFPICVRRILEDETLLSMACSSNPNCNDENKERNDAKEDWYAVSLISFNRPSDRVGFFKFAKFIGPCFAELFGGRCHWGKYNQLDQKTNAKLYPQLAQFRDIVKQFDPDRRFQNKWLDEAVSVNDT